VYPDWLQLVNVNVCAVAKPNINNAVFSKNKCFLITQLYLNGNVVLFMLCKLLKINIKVVFSDRFFVLFEC